MTRIPLSTSPIQDKIFYFAYGANISSKTLIKRLGPTPPPGRVAQLIDPNIALVFGHRSGYATLTQVEYPAQDLNTKINPKQKPRWQWQQLPRPAITTASGGGDSTNNLNSNNTLVYWQPYGMLYELTHEQLQLIEAKEIGYQRKTIAVTTTTDTLPSVYNTIENNKPKPPIVEATVFVSAPYMTLRNPVAPTQRYRDLILQGAIENDLPASYICWLQHLPVIADSNLAKLGSLEYSDTLAEAALKSIGAIVLLIAIGYNLCNGHSS